MRKLFFILTFSFLTHYAVSQITPVNVKCLGGSASDYTNCLYPLGSDGFIIAGSSSSANGDLTSNNGMADCWFVHFDTSLTILNSISFGENQFDYISDVNILSDTSFVLLMNSNSNTGAFSGGHGGFDAWIRTLYLPDWLSPALPFGGTLNDEVNHITPKTSGGYLVCGSSYSSDGHLPGNFGINDFWVFNLSPTYTVIWSKNYGGSSYDEALKVFQLSDGNILVFGNTNSSDNMVNGFKGVKDIWVVKLNSMGDTLWTKTLGGSGYDEVVNVKQIGTDQFAIIGNSNSPDGDFYYVKNDQDKILNTYGFYHAIDANGLFIFGANKYLTDNDVFFNDLTYSCQQDIEVFGQLDSDTSINTTNNDILILNYYNGIVVRADTFGGNNSDAYSYLFAHKLNTTDFLVAASTLSTDLPNYHGDNDILLAVLRKYTPSGIEEQNTSQINIFPNPAFRTVYVSNLTPQSNWIYNIVDISGKVIQMNKLSDDRRIDVSSLPQGIYILAISDGSKSFAKRIVIGK